MGQVYKARDRRLERIVAIKVLPEHTTHDPELRQRFDREAKTISALDHPHICTLYDLGHENGVAFLVTQYCDGETLAARLARAGKPSSYPSMVKSTAAGESISTLTTTTRGPIPFDHALRYAIEIARALDAAHRRGIVHRDLKPGNVMLTKSGVKLLDFGLAKIAGQTPVSGFGELATLSREGS
jgi:serine/threonine protein kinase